MTPKALAIGLGLWLIDALFVAFMAHFTTVTHNRFFWPVVIILLIVLLPINLFVARRMPGTQ